MNRSDRLVLFVAPFLGARIFKRYWPGTGSYWNVRRLNKNSKYSLMDLITISRENTSIHLRTIFLSGLIALSIYTTSHFTADLEAYRPSIKMTYLVMGVQILISFYAVIIQRYNIILAETRVAYLEKTAPVETPVYEEPIQILSETFYGASWYYLYGFGRRLSEDFPNKETAEKLRSYMYEKYDSPGLLSGAIFDSSLGDGGYKNSYDAWIRKRV